MDKYPKPMTKQCINKILSQIDNSFYKIKNNNKKSEIGIFCLIKYKNKQLPVLVATYELINEKYLANNNNIDISLNNEFMPIEFGNTKYLNKQYDLSVIEIKQNNKINFLKIDDYLYKDDSEIFYPEKSIYVIHPSKDNENENFVSFGIINNQNKSKLIFSCNLNSLSNGFPIFNLSNNKLIGIYKKSSSYFNKGIFFKFIINEFIKEYKSSKIESGHVYSNNEINIFTKIEKEDINKEIYFLDNYQYVDNKGNKHFHDNLKELEENRPELYIDNIKQKYQKFFIPEKEGVYKISLKFNFNLINGSYMFAGCENITDINFISFNTKYITNMSYMFYNCKNIKKLNLYSFNTKKVNDMSYMFYYCKNLISLDLFSFNTQNVNNMSYMLYFCKNLENLHLSFFDTKSVKDMSYMFFDCWKLNDFDTYSFNNNTAKKTNIFSNIWDRNKSNINDFENKNEENLNESKDNNNNKSNEIKILIDIDKEDINKEIYFINEFNSSNSELYINNKKYPSKKNILYQEMKAFMILN